MDNLRWILIFAGVAILVALWLTGRSGRRDANASRAPDPLLGDDPFDPDAIYGAGDDLSGFDGGDGRRGHGDGADDVFGDSLGGRFDDIDHDDFARPGAPAGRARSARTNVSPIVSNRDEFDGGDAYDGTMAEADVFAHEPGLDGGARASRSAAPPRSAAARASAGAAHGFGALTQKFEAIGERLAPNRRRRVAESSAHEGDETEAAERPYASKIVMLHVVAPGGEILPPEALRDMFERRGYHHGDMDIYHSLYEGKPVFSVARMIKPGTFDVDDLASFETPGLALILQLPGPVAADTAFEVMLSEAFEMAEELGGTVLDGNRSTLGRQTEQHLRESIHEYMHRQKYFDSVA